MPERVKYEIRIVEKEVDGVSGFAVDENGVILAWFINYSAAFDFVARTTQVTNEIHHL